MAEEKGSVVKERDWKFREGRMMSTVVPQNTLQTADLTSSVFSRDNPDLA